MKMKRTKIDMINATVELYLKRRRYQENDLYRKTDKNSIISSKEMALNDIAETATSRHNSIVFSAITNDVIAADQAYERMKLWINSLTNSEKQQELKNLLYPVFCHLYLEMLHAGHPHLAIQFLKTHQGDFVTESEKDFLEELSSVFTIQDIELRPLVNAFRTRKYKVDMTDEGHISLQKYLAKHGHILIMQLINIHINIMKKIESTIEEEDEECIFGDAGINGHVEQPAGTGIDKEMRDLQETIRLLKNTTYRPLRIFKVGQSLPDASCARISTNIDRVAVGFNSNDIRIWGIGDTVLMKPRQNSSSVTTFATDTVSTSRTLDNDADEIEEAGSLVLRGHSDVIHDLRFLAKSDILLSVSSDKDMRAWRLSDYSCAAVYSGHNYPIWCMDTSLFDLHIATGSHDRTAKLWSLDRKFPLRVFVGHFMDVNSIKFHPNARYLATGSADKSVRLWNKDDGKLLRSYVGAQSTIYSLVFSPDGKYLAAAGEDKSIMIWDLAADALINELKGHETNIMNLDWSPDGQFITSASMDGVVKLWSSRTYLNIGTSGSGVLTCDNEGSIVQEYSTNCSALLALQFNYKTNSPMCIVSV